MKFGAKFYADRSAFDSIDGPVAIPLFLSPGVYTLREVDRILGTVIFIFSEEVVGTVWKIFVECPWRVVVSPDILIIGSDDLRAAITNSESSHWQLRDFEARVEEYLRVGGGEAKQPQQRGLQVSSAYLSPIGDIRIQFSNNSYLEVVPSGILEVQWVISVDGRTRYAFPGDEDSRQPDLHPPQTKENK